MERLEKIDRIIKEHQLKCIDNVWIDVQTARALRMVHDALSPQNKEKFLKMPIIKAANFAWKYLK